MSLVTDAPSRSRISDFGIDLGAALNIAYSFPKVDSDDRARVLLGWFRGMTDALLNDRPFEARMLAAKIRHFSTEVILGEDS